MKDKEKEYIKREDHLMDELADLEFDIMTDVNYLISAKWDSPTMKNEIEKMNKQRTKIWDEVFLLQEKEKKKK